MRHLRKVIANSTTLFTFPNLLNTDHMLRKVHWWGYIGIDLSKALMKLAFLLMAHFMCLGAVVSQTVSEGTTVLLKRTSNAIYLGIDSKVKFFLKDSVTQTAKTFDIEGCKIWNDECKGFAVAGLFILEAFSEARKIFSSSSNLDSISVKYEQSFYKVLHDRMEKFRLADTASYLQFIRENNPQFSQIYFFGVNGDTLYQKLLVFTVDNEITEEVRLRVTYYNYSTICSGVNGAIKNEVNNPATWWDETNISGTIDRLLKIQCKATPLWVGEPIDLITVTLQGVNWVSKKRRICD